MYLSFKGQEYKHYIIVRGILNYSGIKKGGICPILKGNGKDSVVADIHNLKKEI